MRDTKTITLGGILTALTLILVFAGSFVPGIELTLYALSSLFVGIMVIEKGPKQALLLYIAVVVLGFILLPNKAGILPYMAFFGYYGILKFYIEQIKRVQVQMIIKIAFYGLILFAVTHVAGGLLLGNIQIPGMQITFFYTAGIAMMILYDLIFTMAIRIYNGRVKRRKQPEFKLYKEDEDK